MTAHCANHYGALSHTYAGERTTLCCCATLLPCTTQLKLALRALLELPRLLPLRQIGLGVGADGENDVSNVACAARRGGAREARRVLSRRSYGGDARSGGLARNGPIFANPDSRLTTCLPPHRSGGGEAELDGVNKGWSRRPARGQWRA